MTITCLSQVALQCVDGTSDKLYVIQVQEEDLGGGVLQYLTIGYYGRRGSALKEARKYNGASQAAAQAAADRLERDKRSGGYTNYTTSAYSTIPGMPASAPTFAGSSGGVAASTATAPARGKGVGPLPMLAVVAEERHLVELMTSPNFAAQIKYDGERTTVSLRRSGIQAYNRKGDIKPLTSGAEATLKRLLSLPDFSDERETILDGELMGDVFVAYDLITLRDNDMRAIPFEERYCALEELLVEEHAPLLAPCAWSPEERAALKAKVESEGMEGMMFRSLEAFYTSGRTDALLKHKLWATCTCRVLTVNAKRSIQLALLDDAGNEVFVGNVTVPANQDIPEPDDLVEVRYLYAHEGGSLYQPTLLRKRDDVDEADKRKDLRLPPPEKRGTVVAETV